MLILLPAIVEQAGHESQFGPMLASLFGVVVLRTRARDDARVGFRNFTHHHHGA
jgi:hypothetical protein